MKGETRVPNHPPPNSNYQNGYFPQIKSNKMEQYLQLAKILNSNMKKRTTGKIRKTTKSVHEIDFFLVRLVFIYTMSGFNLGYS